MLEDFTTQECMIEIDGNIYQIKIKYSISIDSLYL